jgi:uncharacterized membrane protein
MKVSTNVFPKKISEIVSLQKNLEKTELKALLTAVFIGLAFVISGIFLSLFFNKSNFFYFFSSIGFGASVLFFLFKTFLKSDKNKKIYM